MLPRPPTSTLFPYTTLFRSKIDGVSKSNQHPTLAILRHTKICNFKKCFVTAIAQTFKLVPNDFERLGYRCHEALLEVDRKSTRLNSSHMSISYAVFCLKKKT